GRREGLEALKRYKRCPPNQGVSSPLFSSTLRKRREAAASHAQNLSLPASPFSFLYDRRRRTMFFPRPRRLAFFLACVAFAVAALHFGRGLWALFGGSDGQLAQPHVVIPYHAQPQGMLAAPANIIEANKANPVGVVAPPTTTTTTTSTITEVAAPPPFAKPSYHGDLVAAAMAAVDKFAGLGEEVLAVQREALAAQREAAAAQQREAAAARREARAARLEALAARREATSAVLELRAEVKLFREESNKPSPRDWWTLGVSIAALVAALGAWLFPELPKIIWGWVCGRCTKKRAGGSAGGGSAADGPPDESIPL
ncbi:hypothetical protein QBC39DRAFT_418168, partial [Podospora conica]